MLAQNSARRIWTEQFVRSSPTDEGTETSIFEGDIQSSLIMMTGPLMQRATSARGNNLLERLLKSETSVEKKVEHLFLASVARPPTRQELALARKLLADPSNDPTIVLQDVLWALLNSNEFILDH